MGVNNIDYKKCFTKYGNGCYEKLLLFADYLEREGNERGLIGPKETTRIWERHILNCASVGELISMDDEDILVDVGSGAGFPGVVLACMFPKLKVILVESMQRRVDWLEYIKNKLDLDNVEIIRGRAEEVVKQYGKSAKYVTARAVANLTKLLKWTMPFLKDGGKLLALKGEKAREELSESAHILKKMAKKQEDGSFGIVHSIQFCEHTDSTNIVEIVQEKHK